MRHGKIILARRRIREKWRNYWLTLPDEPSADLYEQATVARLTSFLAQATASGRRSQALKIFRAAAVDGKLKMSDADWLPASLLEQTLTYSDALSQSGARWRLVGHVPEQQVRCELADGGGCVGVFQLRNRAVIRADRISKPRAAVRRRGGFWGRRRGSGPEGRAFVAYKTCVSRSWASSSSVASPCTKCWTIGSAAR